VFDEVRQSWQRSTSMPMNIPMPRQVGLPRVPPGAPPRVAPWHLQFYPWIEYWYPAVQVAVFAALWIPALFIRMCMKRADAIAGDGVTV
jgi:hypothetical protein